MCGVRILRWQLREPYFFFPSHFRLAFSEIQHSNSSGVSGVSPVEKPIRVSTPLFASHPVLLRCLRKFSYDQCSTSSMIHPAKLLALCTALQNRLIPPPSIPHCGLALCTLQMTTDMSTCRPFLPADGLRINMAKVRLNFHKHETMGTPKCQIEGGRGGVVNSPCPPPWCSFLIPE